MNFLMNRAPGAGWIVHLLASSLVRYHWTTDASYLKSFIGIIQSTFEWLSSLLMVLFSSSHVLLLGGCCGSCSISHQINIHTLHGNEMCFRLQFHTGRLNWAWDNLGLWDEFSYEPCPWCRINRSTCWSSVQRTITELQMPPSPTIIIKVRANTISQ